MPPELANHGSNVHAERTRVEVAPPKLSPEIEKLVRERQERRGRAASDAEEAETLAELPGGKEQKLGRWDERKATAELLANLFRTGGRLDLFKRVAMCAPFVQMSQAGGKWRAETISCNIRECAICSHREAAVRAKRLAAAISVVHEQHPKMRWIFLTLTQRNCSIGELRKAITAMNGAWQRLIQRKDLEHVIGWSRSVEVTRGKDGSAHPHIHALIGVPAGYFSAQGGYINHAKWRDLWRSCARLEYDPVVDVRAIKKPSAGAADKLIGAITEVTKAAGYSVKASNVEIDAHWMCELHEQQSGLRFFAAGGAVKDALKLIEESGGDVNEESDGDDVKQEETLQRLLFTWRPSKRQYRRKHSPS